MTCVGYHTSILVYYDLLDIPFPFSLARRSVERCLYTMCTAKTLHGGGVKGTKVKADAHFILQRWSFWFGRNLFGLKVRVHFWWDQGSAIQMVISISTWGSGIAFFTWTVHTVCFRREETFCVETWFSRRHSTSLGCFMPDVEVLCQRMHLR